VYVRPDVREMRTTVPEERMEGVQLGIMYCPGMEPALPGYVYMEYKARPSTRNFTISRYSTNTTKPWGEEEDKTGGEVETGQSDRRGDGVDAGSVESFRKTEESSPHIGMGGQS
jgi:hypothetical protein